MLKSQTQENQLSRSWWDIKNPEKPDWFETRVLSEFQPVCSSFNDFYSDEINNEVDYDPRSYIPFLEHYREFDILWDGQLWVVVKERAWECEVEYESPEKAYNIACEFIDHFWQVQPSPGQLTIPGLEQFCKDLRT